MKCPHCGQEHSDKSIKCRSTGKMLKRACFNEDCSYYGEYLFPLEQETCPCCGMSLIDTNNGHKFVDLGLSIKWATCNVGARKPEGCGESFAWGETCQKSEYTWETLKYCDGKYVHTFNKYNNKRKCGIKDNKIVLDLEDDAAHVNWGGDWRMPTNKEIQELIDKCIWTWTTLNDKKGYKVESKVNGDSIFLPIAEGRCGNYWSSSLNEEGCDGAWSLYFSSGNKRMSSNDRFCGRFVRPVCK